MRDGKVRRCTDPRLALKPSRSTLGQGLAKEDGILDSDFRSPLKEVKVDLLLLNWLRI